MKNKKDILILCILTIIIIPVGVLYIGQLSQQTTFNNNHGLALAESNLTSSVFLPVVKNRFPMTTIFGVEMNFYNPLSGLVQVKEANVSWIRHNGVLWSEVEPTEGARMWDAMQTMEGGVIKAYEYGIQGIMIVRSTPPWAQKLEGAYCGPIKQDKLATFGKFMYDAVTRYSKPPYNIKYWEIWNEPDVGYVKGFNDEGVWGCWGDTQDDYYGGGYFAEMLKIVYPQIKAADPTAQVIVGGLLLDCDPRPDNDVCTQLGKDPRPPKFLEGILRNGGGNYFDGVAFHGYDYFYDKAPALGRFTNLAWNTYWNTTGPVTAAKAEYVRELLDKYNATGKFLMNTEAALICGGTTDPPGGTGCESDENSLFEQTKARYVTQVFATAIVNDLLVNSWFSTLGWRNSGLIYTDLTPRPAYYAYQFARLELSDATYLREVTDYPNVRAYEFKRDGLRIWVIWSMDGNAHTITLPGTPDNVYTFMGVTETPSSNLTVDLDPRYLEWQP